MDPPPSSPHSEEGDDPQLSEQEMANMLEVAAWIPEQPMEIQFRVVSQLLRPNFEPTSPTYGQHWQKYTPPLVRMKYAEAQFHKYVRIFAALWNHPNFLPVLQHPGFRRQVYLDWLGQPWMGLEGKLRASMAWRSPDGNPPDIPAPKIPAVTRHNPARHRPEGKRLKKTLEGRLTYQVLHHTWYTNCLSTMFFNDYLRWVFISLCRLYRIYWTAKENHDTELVSAIVSAGRAIMYSMNFSDAIGNNNSYEAVLNNYGVMTPAMYLMQHHNWTIALHPESQNIIFPGGAYADSSLAVLSQAAAATDMVRVPSLKWASTVHGQLGVSSTKISFHDHQESGQHRVLIFDSPVTVISGAVLRGNTHIKWTVNIGLASETKYARQKLSLSWLTLAHPKDLSRALQRVLNHGVMSQKNSQGNWEGDGKFSLRLNNVFYGPRNRLPTMRDVVAGRFVDLNEGILSLDLTHRIVRPLQMRTIKIRISSRNYAIVPAHKLTISRLKLRHLLAYPTVDFFVFRAGLNDGHGRPVLKPEYNHNDTDSDSDDDRLMQIGAKPGETAAERRARLDYKYKRDRERVRNLSPKQRAKLAKQKKDSRRRKGEAESQQERRARLDRTNELRRLSQKKQTKAQIKHRKDKASENRRKWLERESESERVERLRKHVEKQKAKTLTPTQREAVKKTQRDAYTIRMQDPVKKAARLKQQRDRYKKHMIRKQALLARRQATDSGEETEEEEEEEEEEGLYS